MNRTNAKPPARRTAATRAAANGAVSSAGEAVLRFRKVLELELRRGADDGAVIGGLDRFLELSGADKGVAALLSAAPRLGSGYHSAGKQAREAWLRSVLAAKPAKASAKASGRVDPAPHAAPPKPTEPLATPATTIRGVTPPVAEKLRKLGVETVRDLTYLFPHRHNDFANVRPIGELTPNEEQTAVVTVWSAATVRLGRRPGTEAVVGDDSGTMRVVWFNQPYLARQLKTNDRIVLSGKVTLHNRLLTMESPEWERLAGDDLTHTGRLVPVYPLTLGLSQRVLRRIVKEAVDRYLPFVKDPLPLDLQRRQSLPDLKQALQQMHYPDTAERYEEARRRIAFEELLCVQLAVGQRRLAWQEGRAAAFTLDGVLEVYRSALPFALTGAQERVLSEIVADIQTPRPMARLLQGDVGSGKTAVAGAALVIAAANGYQGAIMAPTEILAEQHYRTLTALIGPLTLRSSKGEPRKLRIELLTGSLTSKAKREVAAAVGRGEIDVVVGTHALIQEGVSFARLGLAVVDEQHRFGVNQRAALRERLVREDEAPGFSPEYPQTPHLLVMSATPIPRTLALTFFGDLDASVIDEMPPGRIPVKTLWVGPDERGQAYDFVRDQVGEGRQAFVVCPLIDESPVLQSRAASQEYERLSRDVFPSLRVGLLHGRLAAKDKESVLGAFRRGELDILVATTVIEVGIDIPNATVMLIEGADRFGLAQLHQLRGRVGRGADQSFCLLLSDDPSPAARQRLQLMEDLSDGFALAEADLRLRGPGDYFGTRQSGLPQFQAADFGDVGLIETARQEALSLLRDDPDLSLTEHAGLAAAVAKTKQTVTGELS